MLLTACTHTNKNAERLKQNVLVVHELSDPDMLNPLTSQGAGSTYMEHCIFMYLLDVDKEKMEVLPWLAKERPTITELKGSEYKLKIDYEIRPEAVWDNGSPVTAYDVAFSFKATKNPLVDAEHQRPYIDFINHIEIDPQNPKKFSFYTNEVNYAAEFSSGGTIYIIPEYVYDPNQLMRNFTLKELSNKELASQLKENEDIIRFANDFNSEKYQREKGYVVGCGPYTFDSWKTGQRIELNKKENWWGNQLKSTKSFENYPDKIIYEIVNDQVTAITAVRDQSIDLMRSVRPYDFYSLKKDTKFNEQYFMFNPDYLSYTYIGLNMKNPVLKDKVVRQAIAHCVDVDQLIETLNYGFAKPINSFVHFSKEYYNKDLKPYDFNLEKAKQMLEEAGWKDSDGDGILDKEIEGQRMPLSLSLKYNSGNDTREKIALFLKNNAKTIGIDINIQIRDWAVYLDECTNHDFDLYILGWVQEAILDDPKQLFHTEAYNGGSNYPGFGNAYTDALIDNLRQELDAPKRYEMFKELQEIVHDEVPYIFLFSPDNLIVINKRFSNAKPYLARPGYEERELILNVVKGVEQ
ncbi:MAG: ABC transporter substrate-binding protein [Chitinophagales bacterium]|nr:ABC transporter substrate-binding protein [Chitinophagales bacterium]